MHLPRFRGGIYCPVGHPLAVLSINFILFTRMLVAIFRPLRVRCWDLLLIISLIIFRHHPYRKTMYFASFIAYGFLALGWSFCPCSLVERRKYWSNGCDQLIWEIGAQLATSHHLHQDLSGWISYRCSLLYTHAADILLPQLNDYNSLRIGGDPTRSAKWLLDEQIGLQWRDTADVFRDRRKPDVRMKGILTDKFDNPLVAKLTSVSTMIILLFKEWFLFQKPSSVWQWTYAELDLAGPYYWQMIRWARIIQQPQIISER